MVSYRYLLILISLVVLLTGLASEYPNLWLYRLSLTGTVIVTFLGILEVLSLLCQQSLVVSLITLFGIWSLNFLIIIFFLTRIIRHTGLVQTPAGRIFTSRLVVNWNFNLIILVSLSYFFISVHSSAIKFLLAFVGWGDIIFISLFGAYTMYVASNQLFFRPAWPDYLIVLGPSNVQEDELLPILKSRFDLADHWYENFGATPKLVFSGKIPKKKIWIRNYLRQHEKVSADKVMIATPNRNIRESMQYVKQIIERDWHGDKEPHVYFITSNYHVLLVMLIARKLNWHIRGLGAPTPFYFLAKAIFREFWFLLMFFRKTTVSFVVLLIIILSWNFW